MTTRTESRKRAARIKELILKGYTAPRIASKLKIKAATVRQILNTLVHKGELVRVPNSNPGVYIDPHARPIKETEQNGPIDVIFGSEPIQDFLPEGMAVPLGYVNVHLSGYVSGTVRQKGRFENIVHNGETIGFWTGPVSGGKGQQVWSFHIMLFGQELKFDYWESTHGTMQGRFYLKRIYVDPSRVCKARRLEYFLERGRYLSQVLGLLDWQITDLDIKGKFHYGKEDDPLSQFIPRDADTDNADLTTDTSPGKVETELENLDELPEDEAEELLKIYANIPSELKKQREAISANSSDISRLIISNKEQQMLLCELQNTVSMQGSIISDLTENLTKLTQATVQLTTLGMAQVQRDTVRKTGFTMEGYQ